MDHIGEPVDPLGRSGRKDDARIHLHVADDLKQFIVAPLTPGDIECNPQHRFQNAHPHDIVQQLRRGVDDHVDTLVFQVIDPVVINRGRNHRFGV